MYWRFFSNKFFLIVLFSFSFVGMLLGLYFKQTENQRFENAIICFVINSDDQVYIESIDPEVVELYLKYCKGELNSNNFTHKLIESGQRVYITKESFSNELVEIKFYGKLNYYEKRKVWKYGWIFKKHLKNC